MPADLIIASRRVDETLQEQFAALSGDRNPMHVDPVAARRTQAGAPVVHGVHTLLWALDELAAANHLPASITRIKVKFLKWLYIGDEARLRVLPREEDGPLLLEIDMQGMQVITAEVIFGATAPLERTSLRRPSPAKPLHRPLDLTFAQLAGHSGEAFVAEQAAAQRLFPRLSAWIGAGAVAEIAACSYVVGMEAPGLHSMFSKLDLNFSGETRSETRSALHYEVTYQDERFRKARVSVAGACVSGTLDVFIRVPPVEQAALEAVRSHVTPGEFAGMKALIVGGSRGLGELTAKLIAAGGGEVTITYALGRTEAECVVAEIRAASGLASAIAYDVRQPASPQVYGLAPTHVFYFATNAIFKPKPTVFTPAIFAGFAEFYIHGFHDLCISLLRQRGNEGPLTVYYPSSVAIEERPIGMTEYSMVKAAGEQLCRDMNQQLPGLRVVFTRLPRLSTDQTTGVLPGRDLSAIDVLLPIVREMISGC